MTSGTQLPLLTVEQLSQHREVLRVANAVDAFLMDEEGETAETPLPLTVLALILVASGYLTKVQPLKSYLSPVVRELLALTGRQIETGACLIETGGAGHVVSRS